MQRRVLPALLGLAALSACAAEPPRRPARAVVFFTEDSAALDDNAREVITQIAEQAQARPQAPVRVRGFSAPDGGTTAFNRTLSEARARQVADALVAAGIPQSRVSIEARGAVAYELMATESRRVEIVVGQ
ncbi:OmpA family protein [Siccirubricoccus sp. KC 17139]|uniref:OmpA family protein n=1 Tax=Siccirubricoccus soli TaxID=2899147 RepID=A0ABT1D651_9PROT|nr:OmpA family protein [Siccirubricoccus soli]MCO6417376.1 OmpA family protein [Siccirubricoccus soli]MCP2683511.1 OmpA family protein [Siccirubricoccus soli]